jgi:hypothetical protein
VAISTPLFSPAGALTRSLPIAFPAPLAGLILAAAGMAQRWRQQTRQSVNLARSKRAQKLAEAKRAERNRLPRGSRVRSAANFHAMALDHTALMHRADALGDVLQATEHQAMSDWFAGQSRRLAQFGFDRMGV